MYFCIECKQLLYIYMCISCSLLWFDCINRISMSLAFLLSLWLNEIALSKVIKMYFMTVCVIKFQKEIHTGFSSTPNLKPWFYALSPVYNSKLMTWKHWSDRQTYVYIYWHLFKSYNKSANFRLYELVVESY